MPIKISVVKYENNYLEAIVQGETYTLFAPLLDYLIRHPNVEYAMYDVDHPLTQNVRFRLKTKGKSPLDVLREVVSQIIGDIEELEKGLLGKT